MSSRYFQEAILAKRPALNDIPQSILSYVQRDYLRLKNRYAPLLSLLFSDWFENDSCTPENIAQVISLTNAWFPSLIRTTRVLTNPYVHAIQVIAKHEDVFLNWEMFLMAPPTISRYELAFQSKTHFLLSQISNRTTMVLSSDKNILSSLSISKSRLTLAQIPAAGWLRKPLYDTMRDLVAERLPSEARERFKLPPVRLGEEDVQRPSTPIPDANPLDTLEDGLRYLKDNYNDSFPGLREIAFMILLSYSTRDDWNKWARESGEDCVPYGIFPKFKSLFCFWLMGITKEGMPSGVIDPFSIPFNFPEENTPTPAHPRVAHHHGCVSTDEE
jgi:hypothetical protein